MVLSDFLNGCTSVSLYSRCSFYAHIRKHKKILCCTKNYVSNKKSMWNIYVKLTLRNKIMWITKKYVVATKKNMWHPKEDSCWLNMFNVAQKTNTCLQKMVLVAHKYMLNWLKKFCVGRKIFWCRTKIKDGVLDVLFFSPELRAIHLFFKTVINLKVL